VPWVELLPALLRYLGVSDELAMMLAAASQAGATGGFVPQGVDSSGAASAGLDPAAGREVKIPSVFFFFFFFFFFVFLFVCLFDFASSLLFRSLQVYSCRSHACDCC
jgi:hypothetical protein